ncbi:hypothetical protein ABIA32_005764 [Streptacidiphilus sp. MAP12-20]|uniref:hypothetical protein n=1 Tax=Streptacidiphilus sp. MAP12-20 TaxID=3156299 RepID=UPI003513F0BD
MTRTDRTGPRGRDSYGCCGMWILGMLFITALLVGGAWLVIQFGSSCDAKCRAAPASPYQGGGGG